MSVMFIIRLQRLALQFVLDIVYFPVWWYTRGIMRALNTIKIMIREGNDQFVPFLWMKNIFVPMFGQYDWQGRIMSFFMRVINTIFRLIALFIWSIVIIIFALLWICLPLIIVFFLINTLV